MRKPEVTRTGKISGIFLLLLTVFILLSLVSYDPLDTSLYTSSPNSPPLNKAGRIGAYLSGYLLHFPFGLAGWVIPALTLISAYNRLRHKKNEKPSIRLLGAIAVILTASCGFSFSHIDTGGGYFLPGGIAGEEISGLILPWFGRLGSYLLIFFLFLIGIVLASEFTILEWAKSLSALSGRALKAIGPLIKPKPRRTYPDTKTKNEVRIPETAPVIRRESERRELPKRIPPAETRQERRKFSPGVFQLPPIDLLHLPVPSRKEENVNEKCLRLEDAMRSFGVESRVVQVNEGPVVSSFEIEPARGVKVSQFTSLADDIALVLKTSRVRIITPVPGKSVIGIEVPNLYPRFVTLREVLESPEFGTTDSKLALGLGKDIVGTPLVAELGQMPHLLIAGTTGSGKTICLNSIILSILFNATPEEVQFLLIDPKRVELATFAHLPHLMAPVVTGAKKAAKALGWAVGEMDKRYQVLAEAGVRNIASYNRLSGSRETGEKMPHIIVVIDELHDLMIVAQNSVEDAITRLAQLSRAVGIHLVIATQRPSVDVITGVIKANLPYRISFQVSSKVDSRTVLDMNGAEKLIGKGDMLFLPPGRGTPIRAQCSLVTDEETAKVVSFLKKQRPPEKTITVFEESKEEDISAGRMGTELASDDELFDEAVQLVLQAGKASTSMLQRRLSIGYSRAARLLDMMEERNIISSPRGTKPRTILVNNKKREE